MSEWRVVKVRGLSEWRCSLAADTKTEAGSYQVTSWPGNAQSRDISISTVHVEKGLQRFGTTCRMHKLCLLRSLMPQCAGFGLEFFAARVSSGLYILRWLAVTPRRWGFHVTPGPVTKFMSAHEIALVSDNLFRPPGCLFLL
jgi:hypothetical protein